jgi:hypothetical protein
MRHKSPGAVKILDVIIARIADHCWRAAAHPPEDFSTRGPLTRRRSPTSSSLVTATTAADERHSELQAEYMKAAQAHPGIAAD